MVQHRFLRKESDRKAPGALRLPVAALAAALLLSAGCAKRIPIYSPRIGDTPDHRSAKTASDCRGCHGAGELPSDHSADDPCFRCHIISPGVAR